MSAIVVDRRPDGTLLVRSPHELGSYPPKMTAAFDYWAHHASYRTFLAERDSHGRWRKLTYAETQYFARRIAQALVNRGLSVERPVVILSGNDIEHALLGLAAMYAGVPYAPISPAYSLHSTDFEELRYIFKLLTPGLVFVSNGAQFERAIRAVLPPTAELVVNENLLPGATNFSDLVNTDPQESLDQAHARVHLDTVFKILFTAGTTGMPKGVINTHRMWTSNQEMTRHSLAFVKDEPPVVVNTLPWSHSLGGNAEMGLVLYNGGSLYIDHGGESLRNLHVIAPTVYLNGPQGFETLIPHLGNDDAFRKHFFKRLKLALCAGPAPSEQDWTLSCLASTETGPFALLGGLPPPGMELKLVPGKDGAFEARVKGPNVTWGYWRRLDQTRAAIDEEGFFKLDNRRFQVETDNSPQITRITQI
jgi:feruloyl-CoA synthase